MFFSRCRKDGIQDPAVCHDMDGLPLRQFEDPDETFIEITVGDEFLQISTAEILYKLPDHIMACVLLWEQGTAVSPMMDCTPMEYVCHMVRLFVSLCPMFRVMHSSLELFSADFQMRLIDSMSLLMVSISSEAGRMRLLHGLNKTTDPLLLRDAAAMVDVAPSCLQAVLLFLTEKSRGMKNLHLACGEKQVEFNQEFELDCILQGLNLHPRGWVFLHSAIESTRTITHMLVQKLRQSDYIELLNFATIAQGVEYSMMVLEKLFADQPMYQMYIRHDPNAATVGRLVCSSLELVTNGLSTPPFMSVLNGNKYTYEPRQREMGDYFYPTDCCQGFAELIAARACAIIVSLGYHSPSLCDILCTTDEEAKCIAHVMSQNVMGVLKQVLRRPTIDSHPASNGEGQLAINCLRAADILSGDTHFKDFRKSMQGELSLLLSCMVPADFMSFWGPGCLAIRYMNTDIDSVNSTSMEAKQQQAKYAAVVELENRKMLRDVMYGSSKAFDGQHSALVEKGLHIALERSVLLIKLIIHLQNDHQLGESAFLRHLLMLVENGAHDYLTRNLHCLCSVAHTCSQCNALTECEVQLLDNVMEAVMKHSGS